MQLPTAARSRERKSSRPFSPPWIRAAQHILSRLWLWRTAIFALASLVAILLAFVVGRVSVSYIGMEHSWYARCHYRAPDALEAATIALAKLSLSSYAMSSSLLHTLAIFEAQSIVQWAMLFDIATTSAEFASPPSSTRDTFDHEYWMSCNQDSSYFRMVCCGSRSRLELRGGTPIDTWQ